jgi:NTP pyrophosphatase (non-canonical NTP hydrolase)
MSSEAYTKFEKHVRYRANKGGTPMPLPFIILGLVGEMGELKECLELDKGREDTVSEMGDALWYLQAACTELGIEMETLPCIMNFVSLAVDLGYVAELGKKIAWHGKIFTKEQWELRLGAVKGHLFGISAFTAIMFEEAMAGNIEKLEKRYPRGFVEGGGIREPVTVADGYESWARALPINGGYDANGAYVHG